jgi:nucleotide-binding universal stress UspA family protein
MYQSILVPLDGFSTAERALPVAERLARRSGARLHLAHVLDLLVFPPYAGESPTPKWWGGEAITLAEKYLEGIKQTLMVKPGLQVTSQVLQEPIAPSLLRYAQEVEADLIVMTTHGRGPFQRFWLGSVADELARSASCPTLFLRAAEVVPAERAKDPFQHILVTLDGSTLAEGVLPVARELARVDNAQLTLASVLMPQPMMVPALAGASGVELVINSVDPVAEARSRTDYLEMIAKGIEAPGLLPNTEVIVDGNSAATAILEYARANGVDLIAMSTRGRGGVRRLLLGSVADKVLRAGEIPVLLFRPDENA